VVNISSCCLDQHTTISLSSSSKRKAAEEGIVDTPQPVVKKYYSFSFVDEGITPANAISLEADLHLKYYQF